MYFPDRVFKARGFRAFFDIHRQLPQSLGCLCGNENQFVAFEKIELLGKIGRERIDSAGV